MCSPWSVSGFWLLAISVWLFRHDAGGYGAVLERFGAGHDLGASRTERICVCAFDDAGAATAIRAKAARLRISDEDLDKTGMAIFLC